MAGPRGRHSGRLKHLPTDLFREVRAVLHGVVEMQLAQAMKFLAGGKTPKVHGEGRTIVQGPETAWPAFQPDGDIRINLGSFANGGGHVSPRLAPQGGRRLGAEF